ncbi:hypothetical protein DSO57_1024952 [Entomophthora muscae]|uniref:Uncharacterized protein n=1 Tax=Entomophthora muscae TaxID=34485 RepID=A0ACC2RH38_9FUNG|nr:hypothetical protein DSO57_1024952 [Entomophthora muscae]
MERIPTKGKYLGTAESIQLYLDKKNQKEGFSREEGNGVRIDNSFTLETWAQGWDLNPKPRPPWAASPMDQGAAFPNFPDVKPLQAESKIDGQNGKASQTKEISMPNGGVIKTPNGGNETSTISFMSLKSTLVTNQEKSPEGTTGPRLDPMTITLEQDNQVTNLRSLINERTPSLGTILLPLNQSTQNPWACLSLCPDESPLENIKFGSGVLYRPKDPTLQTYCHF